VSGKVVKILSISVGKPHAVLLIFLRARIPLLFEKKEKRGLPVRDGGVFANENPLN